MKGNVRNIVVSAVVGAGLLGGLAFFGGFDGIADPMKGVPADDAFLIRTTPANHR